MDTRNSLEEIREPATPKEIREESKEQIISEEIKGKTPTPLEKHVRFFGGIAPVNGKKTEKKISYSSIKQKNKDRGINHPAINAAEIFAATSTKISGCPFAQYEPKQAVGKLNHAMSTHIFKKDGTIDEERWADLKTNYAEQNNHGNYILRESQLYKFLRACRKKETESDLLGLAKTASDGEWSAFWKEFYDGRMDTNEKYISLKHLRQFYDDSQKIGEAAQKRPKSFSV